MGSLQLLAQSYWEGRSHADDASSDHNPPATLEEAWPPGCAEDAQQDAWPQAEGWLLPEHPAVSLVADDEPGSASETCESDNEVAWLQQEAAAGRPGRSKLAQTLAAPSCSAAEAVDAESEECQQLHKRAASLCVHELLEYKRAKLLNALGGGEPAVAAATDSAKARVGLALQRIAQTEAAGEQAAPLPFELPSILTRRGSKEPPPRAAAAAPARGMRRNASRATLAGGEEVQLLIDSSALEVLTCLQPAPAKARSSGKRARRARAPSVLGSIDTNARALPPWRE